MISTPRLSSRAEIAMTEISSAAQRPTTTIFKWVERSAVYIDQFMASSKVTGISRAGLEKGSLVRAINVGTAHGFREAHHGTVKRCEQDAGEGLKAVIRWRKVCSAPLIVPPRALLRLCFATVRQGV